MLLKIDTRQIHGKISDTKMINTSVIIHIYKQSDIFYAASASFLSILQFEQLRVY